MKICRDTIKIVNEVEKECEVPMPREDSPRPRL